MNFILTGINPGMLAGVRQPSEYDHNIPQDSTAFDVIEYLNDNIYMTDSKDLRLFTLDGQEIPLYVVIDQWLERNGHSGNDLVIVVPINLISSGTGLFIKAAWQIGTPSPYWPFFDRFRNELRDILYDWGAIDNNQYATVDEFISATGATEVLSTKLSNLKTGNNFDTSLSTLNKWYVEIERNLNQKLEDGSITTNEYEIITTRIDELLDRKSVV